MQWMCPKCYGKSFIPGKCWYCNETLVPAPSIPKVISTIIDDPQALTAALELTTYALKIFFGRR